MRQLVSSMLAPLPLLSLLLLAVFLFWVLRKKKLMRWSMALSLLWFLLIATPFLPNHMLNKLESSYTPLSFQHSLFLQPADSNIHILVLGAGYATDERLSHTAMLSSSGLARLTEGIRLSRLLPNATLIFSGYSDRQTLPQAEMGARAAIELGINPARIQTIPQPWNTKDEARHYYERYGTGQPLILITDAAHMTRAMYHFKKAGLNPIPAPCNLRIKKNDIPKTLSYYLPSSQNITYTEILFHEYLGLLWAKLGGD